MVVMMWLSVSQSDQDLGARVILGSAKPSILNPITEAGVQGKVGFVLGAGSVWPYPTQHGDRMVQLWCGGTELFWVLLNKAHWPES